MSVVNLGCVLLVEDDPSVAALCARILRREGWTVTLAWDAATALAALSEPGTSFDCVVSDVNMPGHDGYDLLRAVHARDHDLPVLLMTGAPTLDGAIQALDTGAASYLRKPFMADALAAAVARAARSRGVSAVQRRALALLTSSQALAGAEAQRDQEATFERALAQVWIAFQPIVDLRTMGVRAYEALLRTEEPALASPERFLGVAERLGRVREVGRAVRAAVARAAAGAPAGVDLYVNLHGFELLDEELYAPSSPLAALGERVVLEITERLALDTVVDARARIAMLRRLGFRIAVDDLGAGYAALGSLAALEPDVVKLDMSLIRDIQRSPTKQRVVAAMATLCRELRSVVVAEGIETDAEHARVVAAGIELAQGYLFARPAAGFAITAAIAPLHRPEPR